MYIYNKNINFKLKYISITVILSFLIPIFYLFYIQVISNEYFLSLGNKNFLRYGYIEPTRGNILDVNGKFLARNKVISLIYWHGTGNRFLNNYQKNVISYFIDKYNLNKDLLSKIEVAERKSKKILIVKDINLNDLSNIAELFADCKNISIKQGYLRFYPYKSIVSHALGYISPNNNMSGIERVCNLKLQGNKGEYLKIVNAFEHDVKFQGFKSCIDGENIQTTINVDIQKIVIESFPVGHQGAVIILDPINGSIEALSSFPNFDPNIFLNRIPLDLWQRLSINSTFLNRCCFACYPPASIFKIVTLAAALNENIINFDSKWECNGYLKFAGRRYHCAKRSGHGEIDLNEAFAYSCNIPFFDIGKRLNIDILAKYANMLGLGIKTNIFLSEKSGLIPNTKWKKEKLGQNWWQGETLSAAIGQSFTLVTPLQIACMISAIFTGYIVKPRLLVNEDILKKDVDIDNKNLEFIQSCMKVAIERGTARILNKLKDFEIFGKTGTAQISNLDRSKKNSKFLEHAWFVAYFKYKDFSPRTLVILVENAGFSRVATKVAYRFFNKLRSIYESKN